METVKEFFKGPGVKRILILLVLIALLFAMRSMIHLILITFILTYLVDRLHTFLHRRINKIIKVNYKVTVLLLYAVLLLAIIGGAYSVFPKVITQIEQLVNNIIQFYNSKAFMNYDFDFEFMQYITDSLQKIDLASYVSKGFDFIVKSVSDIGQWGTRAIISFVLSLFFVLEKKRVMEFTEKFRTSKIGFIYSELEYFGNKFLYSFGKVIEAQFLIAIVNTVLSTICLWLLGFPQLFGLAIMIFLLGLIPVMGVVISLIPLCAIAFTIGGLIKVLYVVIMVIVIHAIEAYILNPKLMSAKVHLPIFYTFAVLIIAEHFLGVWGLILGVPIFMFFLDLLEVSVKQEPTRTE